MKSKALVIATFVGLLSVGGTASAKGCLAGAAVGGTAGHFAGHHSLIGAGIGCAVGRHHANKKEREAAARQNAQSRGYNERNTSNDTRTISDDRYNNTSVRR